MVTLLPRVVKISIHALREEGDIVVFASCIC